MLVGRLRERCSTLSTEERVFVAVFGILSLVALVPIWSVRFLPLLDEPNHVAAVYIWHHIADPKARLAEFYEVNVDLVPYFLHYALAHLLAYVVGVEAGHKLVVSLYVLLLPVAALVWCRRTKRSPWLSVLTFPLVWTYAWAHGFHAFNLGLVASLLALAAVDSVLEDPSRRTLVAVAAILGFACYLGHPLAFFIFGLGSLLLLGVRRPTLRRLVLVALLLAPGTALAVYQLVRPKEHQWIHDPVGPRFAGVHLPVMEMVRRWPRYALDSVAGDYDVWVLAVLVGAFLLLLGAGIVRRMRRGLASGHLSDVCVRERPLLDHRGMLLCAGFIACYFLVPLHLTRPFDWWFVSGRFAPLICFFAFLLPATPLSGWRALLIVPAVCAALFLPLHIAKRYAEFNDRARPFVELMKKTRPATQVLFVGLKPYGDPAVNVNAYNQWPSWVQVLHGGYSPSGWEPHIPFPYRIKKKLPAPPWNNQEAFSPQRHAGPYDYVLVRNEKRPLFPPGNNEWRLVERQGAFALYERLRR